MHLQNIQEAYMSIYEPKDQLLEETLLEQVGCLFDLTEEEQVETLEESITPLEDISLNINLIKEDSSKYFPFIKDVKFIDYWRTTRVIPITTNDERLSKIITYSDKPNFITVFSGKVTTCVKIAKQIKQGLLTGDFNNNMTV